MVARYDPIFHHNDGIAAEMEMTINGDWVSYDDWLEMRELADARFERIEELHDQLDEIRRIVR